MTTFKSFPKPYKFTILFDPRYKGRFTACDAFWRPNRSGAGIELCLVPLDSKGQEIIIEGKILCFSSGPIKSVQEQFGKTLKPFVTRDEIGVEFLDPSILQSLN